MGILEFLGIGKKTKMLVEFYEKGAVIVDVRTPQEFASGHVKGSINVPLGNINSKVKKLKKLNKPLILCCASGMRSGSAARLLKSEGIECINGGGWRSLA